MRRASAWTLPFLFESPTIYYKFGLDKTLLRGGKLMGLTATILLLFQLLMVSRFKFLDKIFSLNRLYTVHRYNGIAILTLALLHGVSILAAGNFTFFPLEIRYWPEFLGISTAVVMLGIVISANWRQSLRMPYEFWRRTHQVVAPLSITAVCVHLLFVSETFESGLPRWLAMGFASLNMLLIGRLWFRRLFHRPRLHEVVSITPAGQNAVAVTLAARNSPTLAYLPGQFAFIRPLSARLPREEHPFTIASSPIQSKLLQFVIGAKGDWTNQVDRLVVGDPVRVDGPYGVFSHIALADKGPVIMIAGGIGVPTKRISGTTGDMGVTIEGISGVTVETDTTTEEIFRVTGDSGVITKRISARIVKFDGTTNDIIPQGQIAGTATLLNITGMDIPADRTEGEAGAKLTDAKTVKKPFDTVF